MGARLVALIRNPQEVSSSSPRTIHFEGLPAGLLEDQEEPRALPSPDVLVIEENPDGVFLFRYDREGEFGGDTWHQSVEDAKEQARFEYGDLVEEWQDVPEGIDAIEHGIALASARP